MRYRNKYFVRAIMVWVMIQFTTGGMTVLATSLHGISKIESQGIKNFSVSYIQDGQVTIYRTDDAKDTSEVVFEVGSMGKTVGAYMCLKLVEEGKLSLDNRIVTCLK